MRTDQEEQAMATMNAAANAGSGLIEHITDRGRPLAYVIRGSFKPEKTTFLTPPEFKQQVGYVVYPEGGEVARHLHRPLERHLVGTSEVLIVRDGRCLMDVYNDERELVATRELSTGDIMLMVGGGHGFRMLEETILLEVKQGPYTGIDEKERF
jgi:mannose-6-phosphate isomerase-like protein (cupin superfamily)